MRPDEGKRRGYPFHKCLWIRVIDPQFVTSDFQEEKRKGFYQQTFRSFSSSWKEQSRTIPPKKNKISTLLWQLSTGCSQTVVLAEVLENVIAGVDKMIQRLQKVIFSLRSKAESGEKREPVFLLGRIVR